MLRQFQKVAAADSAANQIRNSLQVQSYLTAPPSVLKNAFPFLSEKLVRDAGLEPANLSVLGPKPSAFANFASRAQRSNFIIYHCLTGESTPGCKKMSMTDCRVRAFRCSIQRSREI